MKLLLRCAPALDIPESIRLGDENIELELTTLHNLLSSWLPVQVDESESIPLDTQARARAFMDKWFRIMVPEVEYEVMPEGSRDIVIDKRPVCNGAEALTCLSWRKNSVISDRLAILANLCQYKKRLDTSALEKTGCGFAVCAIVLGVMNGDMSMCTGYSDVKSGRTGRRDRIRSDEPGSQGHGFSWCLPADASLDRSAFLDKDVDILRINTVSLSEPGLAVRGCVWVVDRCIDVKDIVGRISQSTNESADRNDELTDPDLARRQHPDRKEIQSIMLLHLICHLIDLGFDKLAHHFWENSRLRPTRRQLNESEEIREYANASLEAIIDITSRTVVRHNPIPRLFTSETAS